MSNSLKQSPYLKANCSSACQGILRVVWNPKTLYRVYKRPLVCHFQSRLNPFHSLPSHFSKIHFNIILPSSCMSCNPVTSSILYVQRVWTVLTSVTKSVTWYLGLTVEIWMRVLLSTEHLLLSKKHHNISWVFWNFIAVNLMGLNTRLWI